MKFKNSDGDYLEVYPCKLHKWGVNIVIEELNTNFAQMWLTPAKARKIAAALVKAADEAEKPKAERRGMKDESKTRNAKQGR